MTKENGNRLATVTYSEVKSQLGFLGDLPYELANSVTNVYWRFFEVGLDSELTFSAEEMDIRMRQFNAIAAAVTEVRRLKGNKLTNAAAAIAFYYVNLLKYRMPDAENKTPIRCMIERRFRKSYDIPDLVKALLLYQ